MRLLSLSRHAQTIEVVNAQKQKHVLFLHGSRPVHVPDGYGLNEYALAAHKGWLRYIGPNNEVKVIDESLLVHNLAPEVDTSTPTPQEETQETEEVAKEASSPTPAKTTAKHK